MRSIIFTLVPIHRANSKIEMPAASASVANLGQWIILGWAVPGGHLRLRRQVLGPSDGGQTGTGDGRIRDDLSAAGEDVACDLFAVRMH